MGKIKKGILGGFSGKVGNVVGANWIGIDYMRAMPASVANPKTASQEEVRDGFKTCTRFLLQFGIGNLNVMFKPFRVHMSPFNAAMKYAYKNCLQGSGLVHTIDYLQFKPGNDNVMSSLSVTPSAGSVNINYALSVTPSAAEVENIPPQAVILNIDKGECISAIDSLDDYTTSQGQISWADVPAAWSGDDCYLFFFYTNADHTKIYQTLVANFTAV